jgi:ribosomal protein S18 acetylase RimI-like enzyme
MSRVIVRGIEPGDELRAAEVERLATNDLRKVYRPTAEALEQRSALVASLRGLVAVIDERVVGVVQYRITAGHLWFLGLGVDPAVRRRGVARALVQHLERIARSCGCTAVGLHTVRETGNVEIFERLGFVVESEGPTDLFESQTFPELSEVVLSKRIVPLSS